MKEATGHEALRGCITFPVLLSENEVDEPQKLLLLGAKTPEAATPTEPNQTTVPVKMPTASLLKVVVTWLKSLEADYPKQWVSHFAARKNLVYFIFNGPSFSLISPSRPQPFGCTCARRFPQKLSDTSHSVRSN